MGQKKLPLVMQQTRIQVYDLTLLSLVYGGESLARLPDGRAVFVPFGLPGERVRIRIMEEKRGFAKAELMDILESSPERISARCKHFGQCGGCHYQHMPYDLQLKIKADILRDQLQRIGKIANPPVSPAAASPNAWSYRNQMQFHLTHDGKLGFVSHGTAQREERNGLAITPISECHLPEESINNLWPQLEFEAGLDIERVFLRAGSENELLLALESGSPDTPEVEIEAGISIVHVFEEDCVIMAGDDYVTMRVLGRDFHVSAFAFFQVNTAMAERMVNHLLDKLPISQSIILDVYCGVGLFSAFLAPTCRQLIGIESSSSACRDYAINLDEFNHVELYEDLAENVLPTLTIKPEIILLDPPRAGVDRAALDAIVRIDPKFIAYVSCEPSTLARDAGRLITAGYHMTEVTLFDLFPQTYHIESISIFER